MVCFAAQNKWVCAPEDEQEAASKKAEEILESKKPEQLGSGVIIKSIYIPKFDSSDTRAAPTHNPATKKLSGNPTKQQSITIESNNNPYAELWSHQLIGVSTQQSAINFVNKKQLSKEDVLIIKSIRNNMDWWVVLYGLYKDKQTGFDNELNLPISIDKPWLRPLKNLQVNELIQNF